MGAIIANYSHEIQEKLYNFGIDIGLLFQIQDDIIDETATEEEAGKTTSNDAQKNSFVNLLGLEGAVDSADKLAKSCEEILQSFDENLNSSLKQLLSHYLYRHR